jgi:hypothetical protein
MNAIHVEKRPAGAPLRTPPLAEDWSAAGWAGMFGGAAYLYVQMCLGPAVLGYSPWAPMRRIAAVVFGPSVLEPESFDPVLFLVAVSFNFILSMLYARLLAFTWARVPERKAVAMGAGFGALIYAVNFYGAAGVLPWFALERGWMTFAANVAFGLSAAFVYKTLERPPGQR